MPWTFAHPAAVLPLQRFAHGRLSFLALVIGSVAPDLAYYISCFQIATLAHRWFGVVLVCLPLGWLVFIFLRKMQSRFVYLLPQVPRQALQMRAGQHEQYSLRYVMMISFSLMLGALTHIVWDAFTHATGWGVNYFEILRSSVHFGATVSVPLYSLLQHLSTVLGLIALAVSYVKWLRALPHMVVVERRENDGWRYLLFVSTAMSSLVTVTPFAYRLSFTASGFFAMQSFLFRLALSATSMFVLLMTIAAYLIGRARDAGSGL